MMGRYTHKDDDKPVFPNSCNDPLTSFIRVPVATDEDRFIRKLRKKVGKFYPRGEENDRGQ